MKEHHIIFVPGLHDQHPFNKTLSTFILFVLKLHGTTGHIVRPNWEEGNSFKPKLKRITDTIDELHDVGHIVSLIGLSAGGSAVLNAFSERKKIVNGAVSVSARLRISKNSKPTFETATKSSKAFGESIILFEKKNKPSLSKTDKQRLMTIRQIIDGTVPSSTSLLENTNQFIAPLPGHQFGAFVIAIWAGRIMSFLNQLSKP